LSLVGIDFVPVEVEAAAGRLCGVTVRLRPMFCVAARFWPRGAVMKSLLTLIVLGLFSAAMVGCEASASVGDEDRDRDASYKKTTTVNSDGDRTVKTETKVEKN
jgi:hypothetical protein